MNVYICARNRYREEVERFAIQLERLGCNVRYAARDTPQNMSDEDIYHNNMELITSADLFLAYFVCDGHYGIDFAVEVGKASEMGKKVLGLVDLSLESVQDFKHRLEKDIMFKHSFTEVFWSIQEFIEYLNQNIY